MKGLFLKDLYTLVLSYRKNLIIVLVLYGIISFVSQMDFLFLMMLPIMVFYTMTSVTLDDSCHWDRYARTLPISASQVVLSKYLVSLFFVGSAFLYSLTLGSLRILLSHQDPMSFCMILVSFLAGSLFLMSIVLPAVFQWGPDKARNVLLTLFIVVFIGIYLLSQESWFVSLLRQGSFHMGWSLLPFVFSLVVLCLFISYLISARIYARKEF